MSDGSSSTTITTATTSTTTAKSKSTLSIDSIPVHHRSAMSSLHAPLRSALKNSSRPGTPTGTPMTLSPAQTRISLPPSDPPTSALSRSASSSSIGITVSSPTAHSPLSGAPYSGTHPGFSLAGSHPQATAPAVLAPHYTPKVSFDTFENPAASMFSFTLHVMSDGYKRDRNTRVFLCASSPDESGREALEWCLESLVQDGDELIVFRGADEDVFDKNHNIVREEARALMLSMQSKCTQVAPQRKLSLILEYIPGKVTDSIDRLIALYRPDSLIVGTRGRRLAALGAGLLGGGAGLLGMGSGGSIGSVSKYCLSHSPVPVIVVRPGRKLRKAVEKRRADPKRGRHFE